MQAEQNRELEWLKKCREEDIKYRFEQLKDRQLSESRRFIDEKAQILKSVSMLSALMTCFCTMMYVEIDVPPGISAYIMVTFGAINTFSSGITLISMLTCTFILVGLMKFDCKQRDLSVQDFWARRCKGDWKRCIQAFTIAVPLYVLGISLQAWIIFFEYPLAALLTTVFAGSGAVVFFLYIESTWGVLFGCSRISLFKPLVLK